MFPTFISILDIQSWWEVPSIAHFCSLFRAAFNLLDFDIEDLEEALLTDGTEETSWLQELIVRLLSGCLANNEISTFNYQMFLRRLFRQKCQEHDRYNPFNTDIDFQFLPLRTKVEILQALCDFRLDAEDVLDHLKNLEADSLRVEPLGYDDNGSAYWYFYGTRLYREDNPFKHNKKVKPVWQVICFTEDDWYQLARKFRKSSSKAERQLYRTLSENFLPELPRLFQEKEVLHRKRLLEWLPRRTSARLDTKRQQIKETEVTEEVEPQSFVESNQQEEEESDEAQEEEEEEEDNKDQGSIVEDQRDETSVTVKTRKKHHKAGYEKGKKRKDPSVDPAPPSTPTTKRKPGPQPKRNVVEMADRRKQRDLRSLRDKTKDKTSKLQPTTKDKSQAAGSALAPGATPVGRQTNNSLASATGQIVIQSVSNPHRKKLKTSQVFRQSAEDLQTGMYKILEAVKNHDDAWPFVEPVDEEYAPNYYTVIRRPMDLQRMEDKLDSGAYVSFGKFRQDFQLIVDNCRLYNGTDNEYTEMVDTIQQAFQRATDRYLDQISSSDEEIAVEFQDPLKQKGGAVATTTVVNTHTKRKKCEIATPVVTTTSTTTTTTKRKPTSLANTADKRDRSASEDSVVVPSKKVDLSPEVDKIKSAEKHKNGKGKTLQVNSASSRTAKNNTKDVDPKAVKQTRRGRKARQSPSQSPARSSRSRSRSLKKNRSPSWPPSSPEHWKSSEKRDTSPVLTSPKKQAQNSKEEGKSNKPDKHVKTKGKQKQWKDVFKDKKNSNKPEKELPKAKDKDTVKVKDKNFKLAETIEKLKAKSELSLSDDGILRTKPKEEKPNTIKEKKEKETKEIKEKPDKPSPKKPIPNKNKPTKPVKEPTAKSTNKTGKCEYDFDEEDANTKDSTISEGKKGAKKVVKKAPVKNVADIEALTAATEQTLKDINKWLADADAPPFSEFSSASNSPSHFIGADDSEVGSKIDQEYRKSLKMDKPMQRPRDGQKDLFKRRMAGKDPAKLVRRREVQRTIERLQPGKSKGNLLSNIQNSNKPEELFPLGPLSKQREAKNSLVVKQDDSGPKLSLGTVLDNFGQQHNFSEDAETSKDVDSKDIKNEIADAIKKLDAEDSERKNEEVDVKKVELSDNKTCTSATTVLEKKEVKCESKATPNLSAWFKAFGAPKVQLTQKKKHDNEEEKKEVVEPVPPVQESTIKLPTPDHKPPSAEESRKVISPEPDSPAGLSGQGQPATRQRRGSTGSSVSERSSFSQDMDSSPRMSIDERIGAYPAPYPSPLHRSPASASPVMASPRQEEPQRPYPPLNGSIRVGFYQDTVSTKSSPDKSCSPRDQPQSPYPQYSEHVYTPPNTIQGSGFYSNPTYYSQNPPTYANTNPSPVYGERSSISATNPSPVYDERNNSNNVPYYDTNKPLTDQYNATKAPPSSTSFPPSVEGIVNSPETIAPSSEAFRPVQSPILQPVQSQIQPPTQATIQPIQQVQNLNINPNPNIRAPEKQSTMFPVKKRLYSENDLSNINRTEQDIPSDQQQLQQQDSSRDSTSFQHSNRGLELGIMTGRQLNIISPVQHLSPNMQQQPELRPASREQKQYITPQTELRNNSEMPPSYPRPDSRGVNLNLKPPYDSPQIDLQHQEMQQQQQQQQHNMQLPSNQQLNVPSAMRPMSFPTSSANPYNLQNHENTYALNRSLEMNTRQQEPDERTKLEVSKLNMGYLNPNPNIDMTRTAQYQSLNYTNRPPSRPTEVHNPPQNVGQSVSAASPPEHMNLSMRYPDSRVMPIGYRPPGLEIPRSESQTTLPRTSMQNADMLQVPQATRTSTSMSNRMAQGISPETNFKPPDMTIPRPAFSSQSALGMDQTLGLRGNLANLSHIVERYPTDERLLSSLQTSTSYYTDKGLPSPHIFSKGISTANTVSSSLPMFSQPNIAMSYGRDMQQSSTNLTYSHGMTELQTQSMLAQAGKQSVQQQNYSQGPQVQQQQVQQQANVQQMHPQQTPQQVPVSAPPEKKSRKRKSKQQQQQQQQQQPSTAINASNETAAPSQQGFQSYAGLKNSISGEPSAISLKTASVVPGSAFNYGPPPTGLGLPSGLYSDKESYPNFLEEYRPAHSNFYMAAAAAAHRATPEAGADKTVPARGAHQQTAAPTPAFPFLGHPQQRAPGYASLTSPFMGPHAHQAPPPSSLMDPNSPLYQQYLHTVAGGLHQGLLGAPAGYPPGYHPALSMRQPYDSMPRPSWL